MAAAMFVRPQLTPLLKKLRPSPTQIRHYYEMALGNILLILAYLLQIPINELKLFRHF